MLNLYGNCLRAILAEIKDNNVCFVFPSETAASAWARGVCSAPGAARSVAANRFMAWDHFKETVVRSDVKDKKPASAPLRKLFAIRLAKDNAASPFLRTIIPPDYADNGGAFARSIASMLPSLAFWETKITSSRDPRLTGSEDADLAAIKTRYASFLEEHNLFEPSWEKPPFRCGNKRYLIFFPEVIEDFPEYRELLESHDAAVRFVYVEDAAPDGGESVNGGAARFRFFDSAREELREAVLVMRRLHAEGVPYADMAVSLPGFGDVEPYLVRELSLYGIPCTRRAGKSLSDYGAGRLFSLIKECAASSFSFDSVKSLLLNAVIPWKNPALNRDLVSFGINNHCVSSFTEKTPHSAGNRTVDVWEEAFRNAGGVELERFYRLLKQRVSAITEAKTFAAMRKQYFAFSELLDMERCSPESGAVLARCVEELSALIDLENEYRFADGTAALPVKAFDFYVSHLGDKKYVTASSGGGVNIYDYPVAAGAPFAYHFVLNASQSAATVQYRPLQFLRQDKRNLLGLEDRDVSPLLFRLFCAASRDSQRKAGTWFSASGKSFSGWAIPHSFFAAVKKAPDTGDPSDTDDPSDTGDPADADNSPDTKSAGFFIEEKLWWAAGNGADKTGGADQTFPRRLFPVQKDGFNRWRETLLAAPSGEKGAGLRYPAGPVRAELAGRIAARKGADEISVSATDLTEFFACPVSWLFARVLDLEPYSIDAAMLDDRSLGNVYHKILQRLFTQIKEEDGSFQSGRLEQYRERVRELSLSVIRGEKEFRGLLAWPLLENLAEAMAKRIRAMLAAEAKYFSGLKVDLLEEKRSFTNGAIRFTGMIDRVSVSGQGAVIIDYKTGAAPAGKDCVLSEGALINFQMPVYIKLYEETAQQKVCGAYFFSINGSRITQVVGTLARKGGSAREDYQETIDALDGYAERFRDALARLDFSREAFPGGACVSCDYRAVCRTLYTLNRTAGKRPQAARMSADF
jgi:RecB family exonuclease